MGFKPAFKHLRDSGPCSDFRASVLEGGGSVWVCLRAGTKNLSSSSPNPFSEGQSPKRWKACYDSKLRQLWLWEHRNKGLLAHSLACWLSKPGPESSASHTPSVQNWAQLSRPAGYILEQGDQLFWSCNLWKTKSLDVWGEQRGPWGSRFICIMLGRLWIWPYVPSTTHIFSLWDLSVLLRDILICNENKYNQKDGKYKSQRQQWLWKLREQDIFF